MKRPPLKRLALVLFVLLPLAAWMVVRPVRVLAPQLAGVSCPSPIVCVDDFSQLEAARTLYGEALAFVSGNVAAVQGQPRVIFCATEACADAFGLGARSAVSLGTFGIVIGPRAWSAHYVRHEIIHFLQAERIGALRLLFKPAWFVEGMAYGLSQDPRIALREPFESYRQRFFSWYAAIGQASLWSEAGKL